tara:strand:+ start:3269 stop:3739 length:471 start_codon:yes stop_codon:yes gene_type:complete
VWFDIFKVNISALQGDVEGRKINISRDKSCEEKYIKFIENLYDEFDYDPWFNDSIVDSGIPEELFCLLVENLDNFFSGPKPTPQSASLYNWIGREGGYYSLDIYGILEEGYSPFLITLTGPMKGNKKKKRVGFEKVYSKVLAKKRYDKIKSCWERA